MPRPKPSDKEPALIVELRAAIVESGANNYQLAAKAGIDPSALRKFMNRSRSLSLDSAARLVEALGVKVARPAKPRKFAGRKVRTLEKGEELISDVVPSSINLAGGLD